MIHHVCVLFDRVMLDVLRWMFATWWSGNTVQIE